MLLFCTYPCYWIDFYHRFMLFNMQTASKLQIIVYTLEAAMGFKLQRPHYLSILRSFPQACVKSLHYIILWAWIYEGIVLILMSVKLSLGSFQVEGG